MVFNVLLSPQPWKPPSSAMRRLCELQTVRAGILRNRVEWQDRVASGLGDSTATPLAAMTIDHFTTQLEAIDRAICETIDQDAELRSRPTCCSVSRGAVRRWPVCWTEMPEPGLCGAVARSSPMRGSIQAPTGPVPRSTVRRASPKSAMPRSPRRSTCQRCPRCGSILPSRPLSRASKSRRASVTVALMRILAALGLRRRTA